LKSKLELRFGEEYSILLFSIHNRRQKFGEDFVTLGTDLER